MPENAPERRTYQIQQPNGGPCQLRAAEDQGGGLTLSGHAAVFDREANLGWFREVIRPGAFRESIARGDDVRGLFNHNPNVVLGRRSNGSLDVREDEIGLAYRISLPDTQSAKDVYASVKRGDISQSSFGFIVRQERWTLMDDGAPDLREVLQADLFDVSPVTFPAYDSTDVSVARAARDREREARDKQIRPIFSPVRRRLLRARVQLSGMKQRKSNHAH